MPSFKPAIQDLNLCFNKYVVGIEKLRRRFEIKPFFKILKYVENEQEAQEEYIKILLKTPKRKVPDRIKTMIIMTREDLREYYEYYEY